MEARKIQELMQRFEEAKHITSEGIEFWLARELQPLLGYEKRQRFSEVIERAKISGNSSGVELSDHFTDVGKTIRMPKGALKTVSDFMLTRYACYLIAQNGDPRKPEIAFAGGKEFRNHS